MAILCGIDFSAAAERALTAAANLAARTHTPLHVVHSIQPGADGPGNTQDAGQLEWVKAQLERQAERARALGADVHLHLQESPPDETLIALAAEVHAQLIVIGPRSSGSSQFGHAERLVQRSHTPLLVVRDSAPFAAWLHEQRPLRVLLGADLSLGTDAAVSLIEDWRRLAPCDLTAVHLYWPPYEFERLGLEGVRSYLDPDPDVVKTLTRELTQRFAPTTKPESVRVEVVPHMGRLGDRLAELAHEREAGVLVVGTHARSALGRVWEGSVSRWALHAARTNVLCVPAPTPMGAVRVPRMQNVLAATDLSAAGNAALGLAFAIAQPGGTVHIVHVVDPRPAPPLAPRDIFAPERSAELDPKRERIHAALAALAPSDVRDRVVRYHILESSDPGSAISQAAIRLDADAICVGRHGRSNLGEKLFGSVSKHVLASAARPVFVAQTARD